MLSVLGDGGYPYGMPMNHYYCEADGRLYFHCGTQKSHRRDALQSCAKASFCVLREEAPDAGDWAKRFASVIVFGTVEFVADHEKAMDICRRLSRRFIQNEAEIEAEVRAAGARTECFSLSIEHITGKRIREA